MQKDLSENETVDAQQHERLRERPEEAEDRATITSFELSDHQDPEQGSLAENRLEQIDHWWRETRTVRPGISAVRSAAL